MGATDMVDFYAPTPYGFAWGAAKVTRVGSLPDGAVVLSVRGKDGAGVDIRVSPAGRSVRVWDSRTGKELT